MIVWKDLEFKLEFENLDTRLKYIVYALAGYLQLEIDKDLIVTSVYREDSAIHGDYRGLDFRIAPKNGEPIYTEREIAMIREFCDYYVYDIKRMNLKVLFIHDAGTGLHGHLQVPPNNNFVLLTKETYYDN